MQDMEPTPLSKECEEWLREIGEILRSHRPFPKSYESTLPAHDPRKTHDVPKR